MNARAHVVFSGKVQGVWFRANTQQKADELNVTGWVQNLRNGSVEAVFEGEKTKVEKVIDWCTNSQPYAKVNNVDLNWEDFKAEFKGFKIRR